MGEAKLQDISTSVAALSSAAKLPPILSFFILVIALDMLDKGLSAGIAALVLKLIPEEKQILIRNSSWRQKPLSEAELKTVNSWSRDVRHSARVRMTRILLGVSFGLVVIMSGIGLRLYLEGIATDSMGSLLFRVILILSGFFILIVAFGLWSTGIYTIYPIDSMAMCVDEFVKAGNDQARLDEMVKKLRAIDIHTGDEVEKLYQAVCNMALNQTEQIRSIRHFSDNTSKMQDGLIITLADIVESRDSDTGFHVQKTAAYVKIIMNGL